MKHSDKKVDHLKTMYVCLIKRDAHFGSTEQPQTDHISLLSLGRPQSR